MQRPEIPFGVKGHARALLGDRIGTAGDAEPEPILRPTPAADKGGAAFATLVAAVRQEMPELASSDARLAGTVWAVLVSNRLYRTVLNGTEDLAVVWAMLLAEDVPEDDAPAVLLGAEGYAIAALRDAVGSEPRFVSVGFDRQTQMADGPYVAYFPEDVPAFVGHVVSDDLVGTAGGEEGDPDPVVLRYELAKLGLFATAAWQFDLPALIGGDETIAGLFPLVQGEPWLERWADLVNALRAQIEAQSA